jgi:pilus assembly protein CpaE
VIARLRGESGQASIEFAGMLWWIVFLALAVWQLLLVTWAGAQASNAARTASRVQARGGDAAKAARNALTPVLRDHLIVKIDGETAVVKVRIPIFVPGLYSNKMRVSGRAVLPA